MLVLWSFAVAKPLFDVLAEDPAFLVSRDLSSTEIVVFAVFLAILAPLPLALLPALLGRISAGAGDRAQLAVIATGAAAIASQALQSAWDDPPWVPLVALALAAGIAAGAAYARTEFVPAVLTVLSPAPLLFAGLFLFTAPISSLVSPAAVEGESAKSVGSGAPVVMLVFDELPLASLLDRAGGIDSSRYPGFAELAGEATWYRHAASPAANTHLAVPAMLSGKVNDSNRPPIASEYPRNLFTILEGHRAMHVNESVTALCPERLCPIERSGFGERLSELSGDLGVVAARRILPPRLANELPDVDQGFGHFLERSDGGAAEFEEFLAGLRRDPGGLHFFHLSELPHTPWQRLPDGSDYERGVDAGDFAQGFAGYVDQPGAISHLWQRHLLQTGYADLLLRRMITIMRRTGAWDRSLVVALADHGAAFSAGAPRRTPRPNTVGAVAGVPLMIKRPGQRSARVEDRVTCLQELPAIVLGILRADPAANAKCGPGVTTYGYGVTRTVTPRRFEGQIAELARRQDSLFGSGRGWGPLYRFGDRWGLIGRRNAGVPAAPPGELSAELEFGSTTRPPAGSDEPLGVMVQATLDGETDPDDRFAIAVAGRIAAIGVGFSSGDKHGLLGMLPPRALNGGELELFRIVPGPRLEPIELRD